MKTRAAVLTDPNRGLEIMEIELADPGPGQVRVRWAASGLCHSDLHAMKGDLEVRTPMIMGHEGSGVVEEVGDGVFHLARGDHVVCSFLPACGRCRWCATGHSNLCNDGAGLLEGSQLDGGFVAKLADGTGVGQMCMLGTFAALRRRDRSRAAQARMGQAVRRHPHLRQLRRGAAGGHRDHLG